MANHPLLMGLIILSLTFLIAVGLGLRSMRAWLSYVLVLILLGGLLVIFIYISLLASNETQILPQNNKILALIFGAVRIFGLALTFSSRLKIFDSKIDAFSILSQFKSENINWLYLLYSEQLGGITIFLVLYLLLTLIVVVTIRKNDSSSLRAH